MRIPCTRQQISTQKIIQSDISVRVKRSLFVHVTLISLLPVRAQDHYYVLWCIFNCCIKSMCCVGPIGRYSIGSKNWKTIVHYHTTQCVGILCPKLRPIKLKLKQKWAKKWGKKKWLKDRRWSRCCKYHHYFSCLVFSARTMLIMPFVSLLLNTIFFLHK